MNKTEKVALVYKKLGETPLEALERFRAEYRLAKEIPLTYAGRLDPMAEGQLLILIGDECKNKEKYLGLDKEYEVEIVFGIETDSYDALGLVTKIAPSGTDEIKIPDLKSYYGKFLQEYPPYSSKTVGGKQLHQLSRANELPEEMPTKEVEIYSIEEMSRGKISSKDLVARIGAAVDLVKGDFRQEEIKEGWGVLLRDASPTSKNHFNYLKCRVKCSSGTYMRSLAYRMGQDAGTGAFAISIKRTHIFDKKKSVL